MRQEPATTWACPHRVSLQEGLFVWLLHQPSQGLVSLASALMPDRWLTRGGQALGGLLADRALRLQGDSLYYVAADEPLGLCIQRLVEAAQPLMGAASHS